MKCILVNPPLSSPFSPPLGFLAVGAYLRRQGIEIGLVDASIEALHYRLAPYRMLPAVERGATFVERLMPHERARRLRDRLSNQAGPAAAALAARRTLTDGWGPDGFRLDPSRHDDQLEAIDDALVLSTADAQPAGLGLGGYDETPVSFASGADPFLDYYREMLVPALVEAKPDVVGLSIGYAQQAACAGTVVAELRRALPAVPIVTGGSFISSLCQALRPSSGRTVAVSADVRTGLLASVIATAAVDGEGEAPMAEICKAIAAGRPLDGIAGLVRMDTVARTIRFEPQSPPLPGDALPSLDLDGLPVGGKYLGRLRAAPLMASRGCYWNRCAFCDHATLLGGRFRELPIGTVLESLRTYRRTFAVEYVPFCDESMSPSMIARLADAIARDQLGIRFGTMARFERGLAEIVPRAAAGGLVFLSLGLEAASARVRGLMRKGIEPESVERTLDACAQSGVLVECHVMFGFPGETRQEAEQTISFLVENASRILFVRPNPWFLTPQSPIARDPAAFPHPEIGFEESVSLMRSLSEHPAMRNKVVSSYCNEDYFVQRAIST